MAETEILVQELPPSEWFDVRVYERKDFTSAYSSTFKITLSMLEQCGKTIKVRAIRAPSWASTSYNWFIDELGRYWHGSSFQKIIRIASSSSIVDDKDILEEDY